MTRYKMKENNECYSCRRPIIGNYVTIVEHEPKKYYHLRCYLNRVFDLQKKDVDKYIEG